MCTALALALASANVHAASKDIVDTAVESGSFKTLAAALQAAGLVATLKGDGPFTVLAPTDEAFAKLPKGTVETLLKPENKQQLIGILKYHVISGKVLAETVVTLSGAKSLNGQQIDIAVTDGKVSVDKAQVVKTDIDCSNGVIHVIDQVILPASDNIAATAEKAGSFKTLLAAAQAAGLVDALSGKDALTVFAPTDEAFSNLPAGTVESLLKPENKAKLAGILKYHVVAGRVYSSDALKAGKAQTLQGDSVTISSGSGVAKVNGAKLLKTDLDASNGVIHVIDAVLLPSEKQAALHPSRMIESAISKGAPLFNGGHTGECAQIYMTTVNSLLTMNESGMCPATRNMLQTAMHKAKSTGCCNTKAWTLRHALDSAYHSMQATR